MWLIVGRDLRKVAGWREAEESGSNPMSPLCGVMSALGVHADTDAESGDKETVTVHVFTCSHFIMG